jgi:hypothetical protein
MPVKLTWTKKPSLLMDKIMKRSANPKREASKSVEKPKVCLVCKQVKVTWPGVVCSGCVDKPEARRAMRNFRRRYLERAEGNVRTVSGGLPSLGKRR